MNWKLILMLSLFGLAMAILTISIIPENAERYVWIAIFLVNAYFIAKNAPGKYFLHGFLVSLVNCVYIVGFHVANYTTYVANHPIMMAMMNPHLPHYFHIHPRMGMILMGPVMGIVFGLVQGLLAWLASMVFKKPVATA